MTASATEAKARWNPSDVGKQKPEHEKSLEKDDEKDQPEKPSGKQGEEGQGPAPRAAQTQTLILSNFSVAPGPLWLEFTNHTAFALTVGTNQMTANLPITGSGWLFGEGPPNEFDKPILAGVFPAQPVDEKEEGLPVPQSNKKLTNTTAMPANSGIRNVTINRGTTPKTLTINVVTQTAGTVPINSRWIVMMMQGV